MGKQTDASAYTRLSNDSPSCNAYDSPSPRQSMSAMTPSQILRSFIMMAICFSANHGAVTACLGISSSRLGDLSKFGADLGTWQSGTLYVTYTLSAVFGAAYIVQKLGSRDGLFAGVAIYCVYVSCFLVTSLVSDEAKWPVAIAGAAIGGIGGGFLWTAQGAYFGRTAEAYAKALDIPTSDATSYLGGIFAFFYLAEEVILKLISTFVTVELKWSWLTVFLIYTVIAVVAAIGMMFVHKFSEEKGDDSKNLCYKLTSAGRLLTNDPKMKYMIPMNAVFGFAASFLTAYVTGQVVHVSGLDDYVGVLTAIPAGVAAALSLVLGPLASKTGKGPILIFGAVCFAALSSIFILKPGLEGWGWGPLIFAFVLMGCGRATFEGTLRATFADFFSEDLPGAFANIILQSGLSSAFAFFAFPHLACETEGDYCVAYKDGTLHNVFALELVVIVTAVLAILGYMRASCIHSAQLRKKALDEEMIMEGRV